MPTSKEFRHDIQEYSSLLRALKTAATENLSEHIFYAQERDLEVDHEGLADTLDVTHPLARPDKESWTRWPLMTSEINPPQWTFEEEVGAIAERALKADAEQTDASGLVDLVSPPDVSALTSATAFALTRMLALAAANFPLVDRHSQSRVKPSTWTEILELTEIENIFPIEVVRLVSARMERLYPSDSGRDEEWSPDVDVEAPALSDRVSLQHCRDLERQLCYNFDAEV